MRRSNLVRLTAAVACGALAACHDSTGPMVVSPPNVDAAIAELNGVQASMGAGTAITGVTFAGAPIPTGTSCTLNSTTLFFECAPTTYHGITVTHRFQLLDADGNSMTSYVQTKTAAIHVIDDQTGSPDDLQGALSMTVVAHSDDVLGGLLTDTHTIKGQGTTNMTFVLNGQSFTMNMTRSADLSLPKRGTGAYPTGTVVIQMEGISVTTKYDGSPVVTMIVTSQIGGTRTCTYDLSAPRALPVCQ